MAKIRPFPLVFKYWLVGMIFDLSWENEDAMLNYSKLLLGSFSHRRIIISVADLAIYSIKLRIVLPLAGWGLIFFTAAHMIIALCAKQCWWQRGVLPIAQECLDRAMAFSAFLLFPTSEETGGALWVYNCVNLNLKCSNEHSQNLC